MLLRFHTKYIKALINQRAIWTQQDIKRNIPNCLLNRSLSIDPSHFMRSNGWHKIDSFNAHTLSDIMISISHLYARKFAQVYLLEFNPRTNTHTQARTLTHTYVLYTHTDIYPHI